MLLQFPKFVAVVICDLVFRCVCNFKIRAIYNFPTLFNFLQSLDSRAHTSWLDEPEADPEWVVLPGRSPQLAKRRFVREMEWEII